MKATLFIILFFMGGKIQAQQQKPAGLASEKNILPINIPAKNISGSSQLKDSVLLSSAQPIVTAKPLANSLPITKTAKGSSSTTLKMQADSTQPKVILASDMPLKNN